MDDQDVTEFMDDDSQEANSPQPEMDPTTYEETSSSATLPPDSGDARTLGQPLSEFLMTLEDYTPTVTNSS